MTNRNSLSPAPDLSGRERMAINAIKAWRRMLEHEPDKAKAAIQRVMDQMHKQGTHYMDLARYKSQMVNGCATPGDFGFNDAFNTQKRA